MNNNLNQSTQDFLAANRNKLNSYSRGDFINSEDLNQHLSRVLETVKQADRIGINPLHTEIPLPQNKALSMRQPMNMQNKISAEMIMGNNIGMGLPPKEV